MRVKIGDTWYSSDEQPICIQLRKKEQEQIANMDGPELKYGVFPESWKIPEEMFDWMKG